MNFLKHAAICGCAGLAFESLSLVKIRRQLREAMVLEHHLDLPCVGTAD